MQLQDAMDRIDAISAAELQELESLADSKDDIDLAIRAAKKIAAERAHADRLAEALEPFSDGELCRELGGNVEGEESPVFGRNGVLLKLKHFHNARKALTDYRKWRK